jgi:MATE family multidrug resistance protein
VAQKHGADDKKAISHILRDGIVLALLFVIPAGLLLWNIQPILLLAGQDASTALLAQTYMHGLMIGLLPDFVSLVLMQFLVGLGHTRTTLIFNMIWVPLTILCNYTLMFGKAGFPALSIAGIGIGTSTAYWIADIGLIFYILSRQKYRPYIRTLMQLGPPRFLRELCQIGIPMGSMYCIELSFFLAVTLLVGHFGSSALAGNQITLQYLMQLTTVTFAIAQAVTVRMGHMLGANNIASAERATYIGLMISTTFMGVVALCYWFLPTWLMALDLDVHAPQNADVIAYTKRFFAIGALFQLLEAIRIVFFGALRSLKDTRYTLITSIICFWCIGLPVGYLLAMPLHWGSTGLWWGMVFGTTCSVASLLKRFRYKMRRQYSLQSHA